MWTVEILQELLDQLANSLSRRFTPGGSETADGAPLNSRICNTSVEQLVQGRFVVRCINDVSSGQEGSEAQLMLVDVLTLGCRRRVPRLSPMGVDGVGSHHGLDA